MYSNGFFIIQTRIGDGCLYISICIIAIFEFLAGFFGLWTNNIDWFEMQKCISIITFLFVYVELRDFTLLFN